MSLFYTAADVMDDAAALMNDAAQAVYDYTVQLPFLRMVMRDVEQELDLQGFQLNLISEEEVTVVAGALTITYPSNFFIPVNLWERTSGTSDDYVPMRQKSDVNTLSLDPGSSLTYWDWRHNALNTLGATTDRQVRIQYWRLLDEVVDEDSIPDFRGCRNMLSYFTASMCSMFIARDKELSDAQRILGANALDLFTSGIAKSNQSNRVRRRPFRVRGMNTSSLLARIP